MRNVLIFTIIFLSSNVLALENEYFVPNVSLAKLAKHITSGSEEPNIPDIVREADLKFTASVEPKRGKAEGSLELQSQFKIVTYFFKSIKLVEENNGIRVTAIVEVELRHNNFPFRFINIPKRIICRAVERKILEFEQSKLEELANER